eukprot:13850631-Alexandrium_andersonii.AAC.1
MVVLRAMVFHWEMTDSSPASTSRRMVMIIAWTGSAGDSLRSWPMFSSGFSPFFNCLLYTSDAADDM